MSDEIHAEDEVEAHGPIDGDAEDRTRLGPTNLGNEEESDVEAHGPIGSGPHNMGPHNQGPHNQGPHNQ